MAKLQVVVQSSIQISTKENGYFVSYPLTQVGGLTQKTLFLCLVNVYLGELVYSTWNPGSPALWKHHGMACAVQRNWVYPLAKGTKENGLPGAHLPVVL